MKNDDQIDLTGYTKGETVTTDKPEVLDELRTTSPTVQVSIGDERIVGRRTEDRDGNKVDVITVEQDAMTIHLDHGMRLERNGDEYVIQFPDGTREQVSPKTAKKLVNNGVQEGEFAEVRGTRTTTEYEKVTLNKRRSLALAWLVVIPLIIPLILHQCGKNPSTPIEEPLPPGITENVEIEDVDKEEAISIIYEQLYRELEGTLDPANIVRTAQDAYEATDYDMELMGSDLCQYSEIRDKIVTPGSNFVDMVTKFKEKYGSQALDSQTFREMLDAARPLLEEQGQWIDTAITLTSNHAQTTQMCIDKQIRGESYEKELIVTKGQIEELNAKRDRLNKVMSSLEDVERLEQGIRNGTIQYQISPTGDVVVFDGQTTIVYQKQQNVKTESQNLNQENNQTTGHK